MLPYEKKMTEWTADSRKEPVDVRVIWSDAASDNTFACTFAEVGKRATLQHNRVWKGGLVYVRTGGRDARVVLASIYDPPEGADDEAMLEDFKIIPLGWIVKIITVRGNRTIYERDVPTPKVRGASGRVRVAKQAVQPV